MGKIRALLLLTVMFFVGMVGMVGPARAEHFGPIRSSLQAGEKALGFGYSYDTIEWNSRVMDFDVSQTQIFAQVRLGLGKGWETAARVAAADFSVNHVFLFSSNNFNGGFRPMVAASVGGPLFQSKTFSVGPFFNASYSYLFSDETPGTANNGTVNGKEQTSFKNIWLATGGLNFQLEVEGTNLYFGPIYTTGAAEFRDVFIASPTSHVFYGENIEPTRGLAGFAGVRWPLPIHWPSSKSQTYFDLEARFRSDISGSAAFNFTF